MPGRRKPLTLDRARIVMARCDELNTITEEPGLLTRRYGTPALRETRDVVAGWMRDAGLATRVDAIGNLSGRFGPPAGPALLLGSHLDSVRDAGRYDGPLGVLAALAVAEPLATRGEQLPFAVEVIAFADEEGVRFGTAYLGSRALVGNLDAATLARPDPEGITIAEAIRGFGGDPDALATARREPADLIGYLELHIEQGPVLESRDLPVGIVSAITGQSRVAVAFTGVAGHAGTVPMTLRRDALAGAAEFVLAAETLAGAEPGAVATVGEIAVSPGASNVIPAGARLSLDVRHPDNTIRAKVETTIHDRAREIADRRGLGLAWTTLQEHHSVPADAGLDAILAAAIADFGLPVHRLPSGAGHDAVVMSAITPAAMLFVRCAGGVSHHPAESVTEGDVAVALAVLDRAVALLAAR